MTEQEAIEPHNSVAQVLRWLNVHPEKPTDGDLETVRYLQSLSTGPGINRAQHEELRRLWPSKVIHRDTVELRKAE